MRLADLFNRREPLPDARRPDEASGGFLFDNLERANHAVRTYRRRLHERTHALTVERQKRVIAERMVHTLIEESFEPRDYPLWRRISEQRAAIRQVSQQRDREARWRRELATKVHQYVRTVEREARIRELEVGGPSKEVERLRTIARDLSKITWSDTTEL